MYETYTGERATDQQQDPFVIFIFAHTLKLL